MKFTFKKTYFDSFGVQNQIVRPLWDSNNIHITIENFTQIEVLTTMKWISVNIAVSSQKMPKLVIHGET